MTDITTARDLFLHELGDILYVEQKLTEEVLPKLIQEVQDADFRKGLERHLEQTRGHITNLEQIFDSMGEQPEAEKCIGFEGLKKFPIPNQRNFYRFNITGPLVARW